MSHPTGDEYQARFDRLAAGGADVHGEADFIQGLAPAPASVLDAGCGTGRVAIELARRGHPVEGVDRDPAMLATASRLAPEVPWHLADLATFELGRAFDVVVLAGNVLLFTSPGTQGAVLERCAAHTAPGGAVVAGFSLRPGGYDIAALDADAGAAGLVLAERWATWDRRPWDASGEYVLSTFRPGG